MYPSQTLDLETCNQNIVIQPLIKFLKLRTHKYGEFRYIPLPTDESKRKISDIIKLAYDFYTSKIDYIYLITLPYDNIKKRAHKIFMHQGYVQWKDLVGPCKFKELITDCNLETSIELTLDYDMSEYL
jgi:hypothetical protein